MKRWRFAWCWFVGAVLAASAAPVRAQGVGGIAGWAIVGRSTVAAMPAAASVTRGLWIVTDASTTSTCATGGGSNVVVCADQGSTWAALAVSGGAPAAHASTHQDAGSDEISVAGLSGLLATAQTPAAHSHTAVGDVDGDLATLDLDEAAVETELEAVLDLADLQGAVTDAQVPDTITVDLAATATALATNPAPCGVGDFVTDIAADGTLTCDTPAGGGSSSGTTLQVGDGAGGFAALASSSVSGADVTLGGALAGMTQADVDNIRLDGNTLSTTDTNGNLVLAPNGTGRIALWGNTGSFPAFHYLSSFAGAPAIRLVTSSFSAGAGIVVNLWALPNDTTPKIIADSGGINLASDAKIFWRDGSSAATGTQDAYLQRAAAGVLKLNDALQLNPRASPPVACDTAAHKGAVYYDSDDDDFCKCKGAGPAWISDGGAGTCN